MSNAQRKWWPFGQAPEVASVLPDVAPPPEMPAVAPPLPAPEPSTAPSVSAAWVNRPLPAGAASWLDMGAQLAAPSRERGFQVLDLHEGSKVLDLGCGQGRDVGLLAQAVGTTGEAWGIDRNAAFIEQGQSAVPAGHFVVGDVEQLPFADATFDAVRAERVFVHLTDPMAALREALRVTKPGGMVVLNEADYESMKINPCDPLVAQKLATHATRRILRNTRVNIVLYEWLVGEGYTPIVELFGAVQNAELLRIEMSRPPEISLYGLLNEDELTQAVADGALTAEERAQVEATVRDGLAHGTFLLTMPFVLLSFRNGQTKG